MSGSEPFKPAEEATTLPAESLEGASKPFVPTTTSEAQDFHKEIPTPVQHIPFNDKSGGSSKDNDILDKLAPGTSHAPYPEGSVLTSRIQATQAA